MKISQAIEHGFIQRANGDWGKLNRKGQFQKYRVITCKNCSGLGIVPHSKNKFCSKQCFAIIQNFGQIKKGKKYPGIMGTVGNKRIATNGYIEIYDPFHPLADKKGRVAEHRLVIYNTGHVFKLGEHVHHINGNKQDNRLENLVVLTQNKHNSVHKTIQAAKAKRNGKGQFI